MDKKYFILPTPHWLGEVGEKYSDKSFYTHELICFSSSSTHLFNKRQYLLCLIIIRSNVKRVKVLVKLYLSRILDLSMQT